MFSGLDIILITCMSFMSGSMLSMITVLRCLKKDMAEEQVVVAQSAPEPSRAMIYVQRE